MCYRQGEPDNFAIIVELALYAVAAVLVALAMGGK